MGADAGRTVVYRRDPDYWGKDLPVNVGRHNFDEIRIDYYADQASAFEAFKAGEYTFRGETNADRWLTRYDFPAKQRGDVITAEIPARTVPFAGGVFFNLRREAWQDQRVRQAIETMFNFEWVNATLFHGVEERAPSYWERSEMRAEGPPSPEEVAVLEPLLDELPPGIGDILTDPAAVPYQGKNAGERCRIRLEPEDAFGDYDAELVRMEPRDKFPGNLEVGMRFEGRGEGTGTMLIYTVTDIAEDKVVVDGNHPLAGQTLQFACTVTAVRAATEEELEHGHVHGEGGHHHH